MNVLAVDTALPACSVALLEQRAGERRIWHRSVAMATGHAEHLLALLDELLGEAALELGDIDRFAATVGPGSFTGVRIGVAAVRGFAVALGRPSVGVTTLAALARTAALEGATTGPLVAAIDARRGELYAQSFDTDGSALSAPIAASAEHLAEDLPQRVAQIVGSGAEALRDAAAARGRTLAVIGTPAAPSPVAVAELAASGHDVLPARPLYLRSADAKPQGRAMIARR